MPNKAQRELLVRMRDGGRLKRENGLSGFYFSLHEPAGPSEPSSAMCINLESDGWIVFAETGDGALTPKAILFLSR